MTEPARTTGYGTTAWVLTICVGVVLAMLLGGAIAAAGAGSPLVKPSIPAPKKVAPKPPDLSRWEISHGNPALKQIALTFDDGPHPEFTPQLLAVLARLHVKATFFIVGMKAAAAPDLVRAMFDAGHCLANHTYHHPRLTKITIAKVAQELQLCGDTLKAITGETPRYFRPPGGQIDPEVLKMAEAHGYKTIMWSYNTGDYKGFTADHLYAGLVKSTHNGSIILMHDGMPESLVLLPRFVATMREKGYSFVTIDQMAQDGMTTGR